MPRRHLLAKGLQGGLTNVSYSDLAYQKKAEAVAALCEILSTDPCGMTWGWQHSSQKDYPPWVLYLDLPQGQVTFHSAERLTGPDYEGQWDREHESEQRVLEFCDSLVGYEGLLREFLPASTRPKEQCDS